MAYWIGDKDDGSPFEAKDIMVFPSLAAAQRCERELKTLCVDYISAPECVTKPSEDDIEAMHLWYRSACRFVKTWEGHGITKDLQRTIGRAEKWLQKTGRHLPPPIDFSFEPYEAPPAEMLRALNRVVSLKASKREDDSTDFGLVQDVFTNLDAFSAAYSTEQEWFNFFLGKWDSSDE